LREKELDMNWKCAAIDQGGWCRETWRSCEVNTSDLFKKTIHKNKNLKS